MDFELTSTPIRCPCNELDALRKAKADMTADYNKLWDEFVAVRDTNAALRADLAQLRNTVITLCGVVKMVLGEEGAEAG